jgi:hypothetical protein
MYVFKAPSFLSACYNSLYHLQLLSVSVLVEKDFVPSIFIDLLVVMWPVSGCCQTCMDIKMPVYSL